MRPPVVGREGKHTLIRHETLAHCYGADVTGIELTPVRVKGEQLGVVLVAVRLQIEIR
ncbi:MAG: hypothetical protein ABWZ64_10860 [Xanthobacteraceae bacterium]